MIEETPWNPYTMAGVLAQTMTLNSVLAELVGLLTAEQRQLLRTRLGEHLQEVGRVVEFEPDYSRQAKAGLQQWIDLLASKP
jgi:hypothetical protein